MTSTSAAAETIHACAARWAAAAAHHANLATAAAATPPPAVSLEAAARDAAAADAAADAAHNAAVQALIDVTKADEAAIALARLTQAAAAVRGCVALGGMAHELDALIASSTARTDAVAANERLVTLRAEAERRNDERDAATARLERVRKEWLDYQRATTAAQNAAADCAKAEAAFNEAVDRAFAARPPPPPPPPLPPDYVAMVEKQLAALTDKVKPVLDMATKVAATAEAARTAAQDMFLDGVARRNRGMSTEPHPVLNGADMLTNVAEPSPKRQKTAALNPQKKR